MARNGQVTVGLTELDLFKSTNSGGTDGSRAIQILVTNRKTNTGTLSVRCPSLDHETAAYKVLDPGESITFTRGRSDFGLLENVRAVASLVGTVADVTVTNG